MDKLKMIAELWKTSGMRSV